VLVGQFTPTVAYRAANAQDPSFSPDGKQIAFKRGPNEDADVWVMNADGSGAKVLEGGKSQDQAPSWSTR
jgi:Tol biopolymer transport system component